MKLVILFGPPAVGKMSVGQELAKLTGLKLLHNHMSLELINQFFDFGTPEFRRLDKVIRFSIFREVAQSKLEGLIFTIVWAFNEKEDEAYMNEIVDIFEKEDAEVCFVELRADLEERLKRNKQENRLTHKPSKRNLENSEMWLLDSEKRYRMNTKEGELEGRMIFKVDNTHIAPAEVARQIVDFFDLT